MSKLAHPWRTCSRGREVMCYFREKSLKKTLKRKSFLIYRETGKYIGNIAVWNYVCQKAVTQNALIAAPFLWNSILVADRGGDMNSVYLSVISICTCMLARPILLVLQCQSTTVALLVQRTWAYYKVHSKSGSPALTHNFCEHSIQLIPLSLEWRTATQQRDYKC